MGVWPPTSIRREHVNYYWAKFTLSVMILSGINNVKQDKEKGLIEFQYEVEK